MYCPKCKDNFEEGSRRFCPTDGSRLVSEAAASSSQRGGIFANLIPKIETMGDLDESLSAEPHTLVSSTAPFEPVPVPNLIENELAFFELDEPELEIPPPDHFPVPPPVSNQPMATESETKLVRKVQPFEIPSGHVDLGQTNRFTGPAADFSLTNPERFVGRTVKGRYFIIEFLGGDETGLAYLGEDRILDDRKVLVRILIEDGYDEIMSSILAEERISLSHFSHPNTARLIDSGEFSNGMNFLVSEYVDALSANDILTIHGRFDAGRTGRVIRQAASTLNEAHQEGIIHRDIRPENLIIDGSGETELIKVVNFGASNGEPNDYNMAYKAPEVLEGRIATVASDIYSLAVVAFEMLTGELPFAGSTPKELLRSQSAGLAAMPSELRPELPGQVDEIFEKALAYNAAERPSKARDLGDSLMVALTETTRAQVALAPPPAAEKPSEPIFSSTEVGPEDATRRGNIVSLEPATRLQTSAPADSEKEEPNWRNRSPEPPVTSSSWKSILGVVASIVLVATIGIVWYFSTDHPATIENLSKTNSTDVNPVATNMVTTEMPPQPRTISQPPNTNFYQNSKQDLKGDLLRNFVGFTIYYPKDWKVNGPQNGSTPNARGKFLDISRQTTDGRMKEQMLISYYPSKGTFDQDDERFHVMVKETNTTLKNILPEYQMVSEGEIKLGGDWRAYEIKFQGGGTSETGEKLVVWGRRLFVPASRPGARNGYEITMLATSLAADVRSVDDVGVKGELATILDTFEPSQNF